MTQEPKHPHNRKKRHANWGGRRLGAGAPKGNMNALKHGRRSARMTKLGIMLAANPKTRDALLAIADKWDQKQMKATEVAADIFEQILERGIKLGEANAARRDASRRSRSARPHFDAILEDPSRLSVPLPSPDPRSIEPDGTQTGDMRTGEPAARDQKKKLHRTINQEPRTNPRDRSRSEREI